MFHIYGESLWWYVRTSRTTILVFTVVPGFWPTATYLISSILLGISRWPPEEDWITTVGSTRHSLCFPHTKGVQELHVCSRSVTGQWRRNAKPFRSRPFVAEKGRISDLCFFCSFGYTTLPLGSAVPVNLVKNFTIVLGAYPSFWGNKSPQPAICFNWNPQGAAAVAETRPFFSQSRPLSVDFSTNPLETPDDFPQSHTAPAHFFVRKRYTFDYRPRMPSRICKKRQESPVFLTFASRIQQKSGKETWMIYENITHGWYIKKHVWKM